MPEGSLILPILSQLFYMPYVSRVIIIAFMFALIFRLIRG